MAMQDIENDITPEEESNTPQAEQSIPIGIARIREEWRASGLVEKEVPREQQEIEPVVFPEVDGGAGVGDYVLDSDMVRMKLALSPEAIDRLTGSGELDSILVQGPGGQPRRVFSEASVSRFEVDSAIDPNAIKHAAKALADKSIVESLQEVQAQVDELQGNQAKILAQMKDMLLMELRNIKEQDRDLTSYVFELAEELREALPKKKRK